MDLIFTINELRKIITCCDSTQHQNETVYKCHFTGKYNVFIVKTEILCFTSYLCLHRSTISSFYPGICLGVDSFKFHWGQHVSGISSKATKTLGFGFCT